jgi:hypothetical protein
MTEHTPGPWKSKNTVVFDPQGDTPEGHWQLAACQGPNGTANARLIAAAPDLLAALEGAAFHIQTLTSAMSPEYQKGDQVVLRKARAAIVKARNQ